MHEAGARVTAARALSKVPAHAENHSLAGPASGIVVESQLALVMTLRDGKIVRSMDYLSHEDALKAVGLVEEAMSEANVELARRAVEHFMQTGEHAWELIDEEVEVHDCDRESPRWDYRG
jgi:hypothetical protein